MTQKKKKNQTEQQARAALDAIARYGWLGLELDHLRRGKNVSLISAIKAKKELLPLITNYIDRRMQDNTSAAPDDSAADRLFEIMMARFDIFQEHRAAMTRLFREVPRDPSALATLMPCLHRSAGMIVAYGGSGKCPQLGRVVAGGVMAATARTWLDDASPDMSKTMAALSRHLARAQKIGFFKTAGE